MNEPRRYTTRVHLKMHKQLASILVALLTFLVGLTVHLVINPSSELVRQQKSDAASRANRVAISASTCDLLNSPTYFEGQRVRVDGVLYGDFLLYGGCSETRNGPPVIRITFQGLDSHLSGLKGRLQGFPKRGRMELDVTVEGVVEYDPTSTDGINITILTDALTELSPIRPFKLRGAS